MGFALIRHDGDCGVETVSTHETYSAAIAALADILGVDIEETTFITNQNRKRTPSGPYHTIQEA